jgi:hypothetical protein
VTLNTSHSRRLIGTSDTITSAECCQSARQSFLSCKNCSSEMKSTVTSYSPLCHAAEAPQRKSKSNETEVCEVSLKLTVIARRRGSRACRSNLSVKQSATPIEHMLRRHYPFSRPDRLGSVCNSAAEQEQGRRPHLQTVFQTLPLIWAVLRERIRSF